MRLDLSWYNIFPLWIYTRQGKWWTTSYDDRDVEWVYVLALSRTRHWKDHSLIVYPIWRGAEHTNDRILSVYDDFDEALNALQETLDELAYIAAGWRVDNGDTVSCLPYVRGESSPLQEGVGYPPAPPRGSTP